MTNTQTIEAKTNQYFRAFVALAVLAVVATILTAKPSYAASNTFTVNFDGDFADANPGDGTCDVSAGSDRPCTLRAAIHEANATTDKDEIDFGIDAGGGVATIAPNSALPSITKPVIINGYTQTGASPNTKAVGDDASLKIQLDGSKLANVNGLNVFTSGSVIRGLVINRFHGCGIFVYGDSAGNRIVGNFIGTDPTGTLDSGNHFCGLQFFGGASGNVVGGTTPATRNLISGNDGDGIKFVGGPNNKVLGNLIGTNASGTGTIGNGLQGISTATNGTVIGDDTAAGSNTIAFNGQNGVFVFDTAVGNKILRNSIFSNGRLGINLFAPTDTNLAQATLNDAGDKDSGPNNVQNKPVISSAKTSSTSTTVAGTLNSTPNATFVVRLYSNPAGGEEGKRFLGKLSVSTGGKGNASFSKALTKVAVGNTVTATATSQGGDTSEFSAPRTVASV